MKIHFPSLKPKALDSFGISHLLVPLLVVLTVAVGGTYMLVSSHAQTPTGRFSVSTAGDKIKCDGSGNSMTCKCYRESKTTHKWNLVKCVEKPAPGTANRPTTSSNGSTSASTSHPSTSTSTTARTLPKSATSKLLMYSGQGKFKSVRVAVAANSTTKTTTPAVCGPVGTDGYLKARYSKSTFGFPAGKLVAGKKKFAPTSVVCIDPPTAGEFRITYSSKSALKSQFKATPIVVSGHFKQCLFVHFSGLSQRNVPFVAGKCGKNPSPPAAAATVTPTAPPAHPDNVVDVDGTCVAYDDADPAGPRDEACDPDPIPTPADLAAAE